MGLDNLRAYAKLSLDVILKEKGELTMDLKMNNLEAVALMNALQRYVKYLEQAGEEKGILIEKKTVKDLISRIESMPAGEVP
jgi:hypothetical protein